MKKVLSVLAAVLLIAVACVPAFAETTSTISLDASSTAANVGDTITVYYNAENLSGIKAILTYDTSYFEYVDGSAAEGDMFPGMTEINDTNDGEIIAAAASTKIVESGTVFSAQFKVKKTGGTFTASTDTENTIGADDVTVEIDDVTLTVAAGETTTKSSSSTTTTTTTASSDATTAASDSNSGSKTGSNSNSVNNPKTGGTDSAVICGVAVAVVAAAAAVIIKKKNDEK